MKKKQIKYRAKEQKQKVKKQLIRITCTLIVVLIIKMQWPSNWKDQVSFNTRDSTFKIMQFNFI